MFGHDTIDMDTPPLPATPPPEQTLKIELDKNVSLKRDTYTWSSIGWQDFY